jgi:hypothetical protein
VRQACVESGGLCVKSCESDESDKLHAARRRRRRRRRPSVSRSLSSTCWRGPSRWAAAARLPEARVGVCQPARPAGAAGPGLVPAPAGGSGAGQGGGRQPPRGLAPLRGRRLRPLPPPAVAGSGRRAVAAAQRGLRRLRRPAAGQAAAAARRTPRLPAAAGVPDRHHWRLAAGGSARAGCPRHHAPAPGGQRPRARPHAASPPAPLHRGSRAAGAAARLERTHIHGAQRLPSTQWPAQLAGPLPPPLPLPPPRPEVAHLLDALAPHWGEAAWQGRAAPGLAAHTSWAGTALCSPGGHPRLSPAGSRLPPGRGSCWLLWPRHPLAPSSIRLRRQQSHPPPSLPPPTHPPSTLRSCRPPRRTCQRRPRPPPLQHPQSSPPSPGAWPSWATARRRALAGGALQRSLPGAARLPRQPDMGWARLLPSMPRRRPSAARPGPARPHARTCEGTAQKRGRRAPSAPSCSRSRPAAAPGRTEALPLPEPQPKPLPTGIVLGLANPQHLPPEPWMGRAPEVLGEMSADGLA